MAEANAAGVWPTMQVYVMALITPHAVPGDAVRTVYASRSHRVHTCSFWRSYRPRLPLGRSVALMGGSRWRLKHTAATSEPQGAPVIVDVSERLPAPACLFAKFGDLSCTCAARRDSSPSRPAAVRSYPGSPVAHQGTVWGPRWVGEHAEERGGGCRGRAPSSIKTGGCALPVGRTVHPSWGGTHRIIRRGERHPPRPALLSDDTTRVLICQLSAGFLGYSHYINCSRDCECRGRQDPGHAQNFKGADTCMERAGQRAS